MTPVAALPMYDWPEVRPATDALWSALRDELRDRGLAAPDGLDRRPAELVWRDPGLVVAQTCGLPYVRDLRGRVRLVATPVYAVRGCSGPDYRSFVVVRRASGFAGLGDLAGARAAINDRSSQSGFAALRAAVATVAGHRRFLASIIETGSHRASLRAVAEGRADLCAVDPVCWALAERHDPGVVAGLMVLHETPPAPGLPLITCGTRSRREIGLLRAGLDAVAARPDLGEARAALMIAGFAPCTDADYDRIVEIAGLAGAPALA